LKKSNVAFHWKNSKMTPILLFCDADMLFLKNHYKNGLKDSGFAQLANKEYRKNDSKKL
jgi:hypothetical protein